MGRLKGDDLVYIYGHMKPNYKQLLRKDRLWFAFATNQEGKKGHDILKRVYSDFYKESGDVGNYTDFNIRFTNQEAAEWVLADIDDSISSYSSYHPDTGMGDDSGTGSGTGPNTSTSSNDNSDENKSTDWTIYLVIGAAVAIIILLLWDKKK